MEIRFIPHELKSREEIFLTMYAKISNHGV